MTDTWTTTVAEDLWESSTTPGAVFQVVIADPNAGGGGVSDHGALTGLSDDDHTQYAKKASNLSDLASAATARTNLGLGTAAVAATGDFDAAGTAAGLVDDLSGVSNQATARTNLGLGSAAVEAASAFATAAQGVDARTPTAHKTSHATGGSDELALDASQITSGTVDQARLGTGSAGAGAKFLADDQTYKTPPSVGAVLGDVVLTSAQAVVSFASIPATYAHLVVAYQVRSSSAGVATVRLQMRVNNDSGSNYNSQLVAGNNTTAWGQVQSGADHGYLGNVPAANATAGQSGSGSIEIPNYAGTTFWKNAIYQTTRDENSAGANMVHYRGHVVWRSTAAINRVDLFFAYGDFIAGSRITLYGVSGA